MFRRALCPAALTVLVIALSACGGTTSPTRSSPLRFAGTELEPPPAAPDFTLRDHEGKLVQLSALRDKFVFVTFLYANCPDVCPLIATNLNVVLHRLGKAREGLRMLAVSVDPKGDTPSAVRRFVRSRRLLPQFRFLRGTRAELAPVWKRYHIAVASNPEDTVDHSAYTVLIDGDGNERVLYDSRIRPGEALHDLRELGVKPGPS